MHTSLRMHVACTRLCVGRCLIWLESHALDLSAKIRMREIERSVIELVTCKWRRILRKLPDRTKSPSERYKLSVCMKGSCTTCIQAALYNFMACSCPNFVLGRLKKKKKRKKKKKKKKKKKMEKIAVFPFSAYNSSDVFYAICECYWVHSDSYTMVRYLKRLKSSRLGRVQAFPMYGGLGMSAPSLHRESTDSLIR